MSKIKIISDSGCDITKEDEIRYGIDLMSFEVTLGDKSYIERVDMSNFDFYELIDKSDDLPKTSQITKFRFIEKFTECIEAGYDDVIVVLINSTGSATYSNAVAAEKELREGGELGNTKIHIVDSHCYSLGYGYPIVEAAKKIEAGQSAEQIVSYLEDCFDRVEIYIVAFGLRHMKKSGRIKAASAFLGELMSLRPIISLIDGESIVVKKSRGDRNAVADAVEYISKRVTPETPWQVLRTTVKSYEDDFIEQFTKKTGREPSMVTQCGYVVACNAGPQFFGVIVRGNPRR